MSPLDHPSLVPFLDLSFFKPFSDTVLSFFQAFFTFLFLFFTDELFYN